MKKSWGVLVPALTFIFSGSAFADATADLFEAAINNNKTKIEALVAQGTDIHAKDEKGCTPLHHAAKADAKDTVKVLLAAKSDPNAKDKHGMTPLHLAAYSNATEIVKALLAAKADQNAKNDIGSTPLHYAVVNNSKSAVEVLLAAKADPNEKDKFGIVPLFSSWDKEMAELLYSKGANINAQNVEGDTLLHRAVMEGAVATVEWFLSKSSADARLKNKIGKTAFDLAQENKREDIASLIKKRMK